LLERLGIEAEEPVEEFLALSLAYEREHVPSLQGFLRWLVSGDTEVKRDFGARLRDEVRILTVHGAKGLEAPVVFLPDTMQLPKQPEPPLWTARDGLPLWCPRRGLAVPAYTAEKRALRARQLQEYRRLLYVALTRAQDRLYICGWPTRESAKEASWYALCRAGLAEIATPFAFDSTALIGGESWSGDGMRIVGVQSVAPVRETPAKSASAARSLPHWVREPPPVEPDPPRPLTPSRPSGAEPPTISPLAVKGTDRFKRGLIVHQLLQSLPELPIEQRDIAARRFLALPANDLSADEQDDIARETYAVLSHPDFAALFGPGSQAEVPLVGLVGVHAVSAQIDRLVVAEDRVLIVDYKTLRPPPAAEREVPPVYLRQLAIYRAALGQIYPGREIRCALLLTEGPRLMPISPEILAGCLP
jgi:ATP-dependent helicase/nuclease subunit A